MTITVDDVTLLASLADEAPETVSLRALAELVDACHADLAGSPPGAMPELVARLAHQRLLALVGTDREAS